MATTTGTKTPATRSASAWIGARLRCAFATRATMRASVVSAPTRSARMTRLPDLLSVPPVSGSPGAFSTGMGSPVIMLSSTVALPSVTTPSTGTLSPGRTRSRSPGRTASRGTSASPPVAQPACRLRRETHERADGIARPLTGCGFHDLPNQHEHEDHRRRLEVGRRLPACGEDRRGEGARCDHTGEAEEPGRARAERDQRPHVGRAIAHRRKTPQEEGAGDPEHRRREQALQRDEEPRADPGVEGNAGVAPHFQREHGACERCGKPEPPAQVAKLG